MKKYKIYNFIKITSIIVLLTITLVPFIIMLIGSIKPSLTFNIIPIDLSPFSNITFDNYLNLSESVNMTKAFLNSLYIVTFVSVSEVMLGITAGYLFAEKTFFLKGFLFVIVIITMMLPRQLLLIPNFLVAKSLGLIDSLTGVSLTTINASYGIFLTRQRILSIPRSLFEAARLDGCNEFELFFKVIVPQLKPTIAAIAIYSVFSVWNDYLWQNIMLTSKSKQTIPILLAYLANSTSSGIPATGLQLASSVVSLIPVISFFVIFQRWFVIGISDGGIKE